MESLVQLFIYYIFLVVIILLLYDRWASNDKTEREKDRLLDELSKLNAALIAKNANEYAMMRTMDKVIKEEKQPALENPDIVDESALEDDEFYESIDKRAELDRR